MGLIALMYVTVWTVLMGAFTGLPILLIMLCVPPWRRALLRHPRKLAVLALVCVSVVGVTLFQVAVSYREQSLRNPKLDHAVQVEGLVLPAGTRLHLGAIEPLDGSGLPQTHGLASLQTADFPAPNTLKGLRVLSLQIFRPQDVRLKLAGDQEVEGWPCRGGSWVIMVANEQTRLQPEHWKFSECELVPGSQISGVTWPEGSHLYKQDAGYTIGYFGSAQTTLIDGIELTYASIRLDALRTLVHWEGKLKNPVTLGEWTYPQGMKVGQNAPYTLIFRADRYNTGRNRHTGKSLSPGQSIEQHVLDGSELWIKPDIEVEGFNF